MNISRDFAKLTEQLKDAEEIKIKVPAIGTLEETICCGLIHKGLAYIQQTQAEGTIQFIVSELLRNAEQSLIKRSICEAEDKQTTDLLLLKKLKQDNEQYTKKWRGKDSSDDERPVIQFKLTQQQFIISICNAGKLDDLEKNYIKLAFQAGQKAKNLQEVSEIASETLQGEGHGLALCILALQQGNFDNKLLRVTNKDNQISFSLFVPTNKDSSEKLRIIDQTIINEIKTLPSFPELIGQIQMLCESENSDMKQVSEAIQKDQAIAGQIIKLANSGGFSGGNVDSVLDAVKVVGLNNISGLLLKVGAQDALNSKYHTDENLIDHPVKVGFFSRSLAIMTGKTKVAEKAYVAGLLHDIGKVVLLASMKSKREFEALSKKRDRRNKVQLEELSVGASHATIGSLLAQKWKFPETLKTAIEFHHTPHNAPKENIDIIYVVYLANCMANYLENEINYYSIEPDVLAHFNMTTEESFQLTATTLENEYRSQ